MNKTKTRKKTIFFTEDKVMSKKEGKKGKKIFKLIFQIGATCAYLALILILCLQSLKPGSASADISKDFGDKLDDALTGATNPQVQVVNVTDVNVTSITGATKQGENWVISLNASGTVNCEVLPTNATNKSLSYSSGDEGVISVLSDGKIEAKGVGVATVTATSKENEEIKATVTVEVVEVLIESIEIDNIPTEFRVNDKAQLDIIYNPKNTTQKGVTWSSSDETVVSINDKGVIEALKEGSAEITATSVHSDQITAQATITVEEELTIPVVDVQSLTLSASATTGYVGKTAQITAEILPSDATNKTLLWQSSDEEIATVNPKGKVSFNKAGEVTITAISSADESKTDSVTFTVKEVLSSSITLENEGLKKGEDGVFTIKQGESGKVIAHLSEDATVKTVTYESSNPAVAKIGADGVIEAVKGGTVTITVKTSYDGQETTESFTLTVNAITFKDTMKNFYHWVRKAFGHFGAFLVLGIFAVITYFMLFPKSTKGKLLGFGVCMVAGFAVAGLTEILQLPIFTPNRGPSFKDVLLDFEGYCYSTLIMYFIIFAVHFTPMIIKWYREKKASEGKKD